MKTSHEPSLLKNLIWYSRLRSTAFAMQYWTLNRLSELIGFKTPIAYEEKELLLEIRKELDQLLLADVGRIIQGVYPPSVLMPELSLHALKTLPRVVLDTFRIGKRRTQGVAKEFTESARNSFYELPEYYLRNFHFQTNGYLGEDSARVYDYEVELLFSGAADAMRRLIISPMKERFKDSPDGKGLKFLEIGAGTGRATKFVQLAFPKARIIALDLSDSYLKVARRNLDSFKRISFLHGDGAALPFRNEEFDAIYSVFLFHEMPLEIRTEVMKESIRVLKNKGLLGFVDSLQLEDNPQFDKFLKDFPKNFHEPFYHNYIHSSMRELFEQFQLSQIQFGVGMLSKFGTGLKK
ncbi:MAG: class I SAM-dependent methyltransferase [Bdellovibrionia bacterium]